MRLGISTQLVQRSWIAAAAGAVVGLALGDPAAGALLACAGAAAPILLARRRERGRRGAVDSQVPQLLDALAAACSAGLSVPTALRRSAGAVDGPLAEELEGVADRVAMGARWREELGELAERSGSHDLRRAIKTLSRAETLGSPLAQTVADLAEEVRAVRGARLAERARRAPVKMLFPLVFLVLPAFLLLTVVPVLLSTIRSIH